MKASIISALVLSGFAVAAPLSSRQGQTARIELEIESDTFVQDEVPLDVLFNTVDNPRLAEGISASVVSPDGVHCQAFDANQQPLGAPFGSSAVRFAQDPVAIGAYFCSARSRGDNSGDSRVDDKMSAAQGQARIQLETSSDTFVQEEIPIGVKVSTKGRCSSRYPLHEDISVSASFQDVS
jgi:hypothetical protein